jgi:hypothetical protein
MNQKGGSTNTWVLCLLLDWWTSCLWNGQSNSVPFWKYKDHEMLGEEDVILQWRWINMKITAWNVNLIACSNEGAGKSIKLASLLYIWYRGYSDIKGSKRTLYEVGKCFRNWWKHKKWRDFVSLHLLWENILQTGNILIDCCSIKNIGIALKTWGLKSVGCFWGEVCWGVGEQGIHHFITVQGFPGWQSPDIGRNTWPDWQLHILPLKKRITYSVHICWS